MRPSVAILGAGAIGEVLASGLVRAGWDRTDLALVARREERRREVEERTGVSTGLDAAEATRGRQVVVIAVKPKDVAKLLESIAGILTEDQVVISLAAGVTTASIAEALGTARLIRAMPNTPAQLDEGITAMAPAAGADEAAIKLAEAVLGAVGQTLLLDESNMDAVTAVSGTGPAYAFLLAEALTEAAVREGLPRHAAEALVHQTIKGAGALLVDLDEPPAALRAQVTSPGGTTAAAVHVLEERGFRALVEDAVRAAAQRSRELGDDSSS